MRVDFSSQLVVFPYVKYFALKVDWGQLLITRVRLSLGDAKLIIHAFCRQVDKFWSSVSHNVDVEID